MVDIVEKVYEELLEKTMASYRFVRIDASGGVLFLQAGRDLMKAPALLKNLMSGEGLQLKDVHYTQDNPDKKIKWVVDAREVRFSGDRKNVEFFDFKLKVEPENRPRFTLNGKKGNYSKDTGT